MKKMKKATKRVVSKAKKVAKKVASVVRKALSLGECDLEMVKMGKCALLAGLTKCLAREVTPDVDEGNSTLRVAPYNFRTLTSSGVVVFVYGSYGVTTIGTVHCGGDSRQATVKQAQKYLSRLTVADVAEVGSLAKLNSKSNRQSNALSRFSNMKLNIKGGYLK